MPFVDHVGCRLIMMEQVLDIDSQTVISRGKIHIDDSFWRIEGPDLPAGTLVRIIGVDGVVLKIEKHVS